MPAITRSPVSRRSGLLASGCWMGCVGATGAGPPRPRTMGWNRSWLGQRTSGLLVGAGSAADVHSAVVIAAKAEGAAVDSWAPTPIQSRPSSSNCRSGTGATPSRNRRPRRSLRAYMPSFRSCRGRMRTVPSDVSAAVIGRLGRLSRRIGLPHLALAGNVVPVAIGVEIRPAVALVACVLRPNVGLTGCLAGGCRVTIQVPLVPALRRNYLPSHINSTLGGIGGANCLPGRRRNI